MRERLEVTLEVREGVIGKLAKLDAKVKALRKQVARYEKILAAPKPGNPGKEIAKALKNDPANHERPGDPELKNFVEALPAAGIAQTAGLDLPSFLDRSRSGEKRDEIAREAIEAERAERAKLKKKIQDDERAAKRRGDTKRMPLTGKAALAAIRS
jgi:hypothetical protein